MNVFTEIEKIRTLRWQEPTLQWGLIPTMGYLHAGHISLVEQARQENDRVGVSIFVNPTQFNDPNDLAAYPRDMTRDLDLLQQAGVDVVWTPTPEIVYPSGYQTYVDVEEVSLPLEGAKRPGHFRGVTTVVSKLFNVFQPHRAYFGQKDAQQAAVIKQMVRDLNFNVEVKVGAIVREADGLAMSSRNTNLSAAARAQAVCLYQALSLAQTAIEQGERQAELLRGMMRDHIEQHALTTIDYVSVADAVTLAELKVVEKKMLMSLAVSVGGVRLIDNFVVEVD